MTCEGHGDISFIKESVTKLHEKTDKILAIASKNEVKTKANTRQIWAIWGVIASCSAFLIKYLIGVKA